MGLVGSKKVSLATFPLLWPKDGYANARLGHLDCVGDLEAIRTFVPDLRVFFGMAQLIPEPKNPHDPNAIAVYVHGTRVGYVSRETVAPNQKAILKATKKHGSAVVSVALQGGTFPSVILQPTRISRVVVTAVLLQAGFRKKDGEKDWGFTIREEPAQTLVFCSGAKDADREELVPQYAAALTASGLRARVDKSDGLIVRVEA